MMAYCWAVTTVDKWEPTTAARTAGNSVAYWVVQMVQS